MTRTLAPVALLLAASLTLVGCSVVAPPAPGTGSGGGDTGTGTEITTDPATGELITGTGYSYNVPEGWGVPDAAAENPQLDTVAADLTDDDGFADNINVLLSPAGVLTPDVVESAGVSELEQYGATDVTVEPRLTIAGAESSHLSALFSSQGLDYRVEQYYPTQGDQTYVVTFSFSQDVSEADRIALAESVLATWAWS
jgi:hypothetical protein